VRTENKPTRKVGRPSLRRQFAALRPPLGLCSCSAGGSEEAIVARNAFGCEGCLSPKCLSRTWLSWGHLPRNGGQSVPPCACDRVTDYFALHSATVRITSSKSRSLTRE
jgi:hypothetical protein